MPTPSANGILRALAAFFLSLGPLATLATTAVAQDAASPPEAGQDLPLWAVQYQGNTVYLLGSVHLLRPDAYPLDPILIQAFDASEIVGFEIDLDEIDDRSASIVARGLYMDGSSLSDRLPAELHADLETRLDALDIPIHYLSIMKPWLAALSVSAAVMERAGFSGQWGVDRFFHNRSLEQGKSIFGLETLEDQIEVFDGMDFTAQTALLISTLEDLGRLEERIEELTTLWRSGNTDRIAALLSESMVEHEELVARLLHGRNRAWLPRIEGLIRGDQPAIVIVGLGHLVGEGSVVELLRERGHSVVQIRSN